MPQPTSFDAICQFRTRYVVEFQKRTKQAKKIGETFSDFSLDGLFGKLRTAAPA